MKVYKLFRYKNGDLYPLYVEANRELPMGKWLEAHVGELVDETHVKSRLGPLSRRPGFHSTEVPFTDWIGKKQDGKLVQRKETVWCECEVKGKQLVVKEKNGLPYIPRGWYYFKTNSKQPRPWIISDRIKINKILTQDEVANLCRKEGFEPQPIET